MAKQTQAFCLRSLIAKILAGFFALGLCFSTIKSAQAENFLTARTPERKATLTVSYSTYEWWLLSWQSSKVVCQIFVEHEGWPQPEEVKHFCGSHILEDWLNTKPCEYSDNSSNAHQCPGYYLHLSSVTPGVREIEVELLPAEIFIDIADCDPIPPENRCETMPRLHLIAEEPLPNEYIIRIQGTIGDDYFSCMGGDCTVPLPATGENGVPVKFWADSSFGDSTQTHTALIRVVPWGDFVAPDVITKDNPQWYVNVLSTQYLRNVESTCSQIWSSFPPVGGPPAWLSSPHHPDALVSNHPFYYLAGSLIKQGMVDTSSCTDGGLQASGYATQCGLEEARPFIDEWQNQFNAEIVRVANDTGVPAQLMKNVFSKESQFWPGFSAGYKEAGLGHMSDLGADSVLLWNPSFFAQFCPLVLDTTVCQRGFGNLDISEQEMLRGALVQKVSAACPECPQGIDLREANFSISVFARSMLANCEQVGQILYNTTRQIPGEVSIYEDLWRFTLINYNAGPGCLSDAIESAYASNIPLTWENVIPYLEPGACQMGIVYVNDVSYMPEPAMMDEQIQTESEKILSTPSPEIYPESDYSPPSGELGYPIPTYSIHNPYP